MAFRSNGPITVALPAFRGVTRQIILTVLVAFFARLVLGLFSPGIAGMLVYLLSLGNHTAISSMPWQLLTYPFVGSGIIGTLFAALSIWFFGTALESERGGRWLIEYLLAASIGGGILACILALLLGTYVPGLHGDLQATSLWPAVLALLLAYARFHADEQLSFNFILRVRAKYLAALYLLLYLALALVGGDRFGALLGLCNGLAGYVFLQVAPYAGVRAAISERILALRNARLRAKRRHAAKKFAVYMREQGRDVNVDSDGRYVSPEDEPKQQKRSGGSRWMN